MSRNHGQSFDDRFACGDALAALPLAAILPLATISIALGVSGVAGSQRDAVTAWA